MTGVAVPGRLQAGPGYSLLVEGEDWTRGPDTKLFSHTVNLTVWQPGESDNPVLTTRQASGY